LKNVLNFVAIGQGVKPLLRQGDLSAFKMVAVAILFFNSNFISFAFRVTVYTTLQNLVSISQIVAEMLISQVLKMAAVRHIGLDPTKSIWWSLSFCKICLEWMR